MKRMVGGFRASLGNAITKNREMTLARKGASSESALDELKGNGGTVKEQESYEYIFTYREAEDIPSVSTVRVYRDERAHLPQSLQPVVCGNADKLISRD